MNDLKTYVKRAIPLKAVQWDGTEAHAKELINRLSSEKRQFSLEKNALGVKFYVKTLEALQVVLPKAWLIIGVQGEVYPCRDDIFKETYMDAENSVSTTVYVLVDKSTGIFQSWRGSTHSVFDVYWHSTKDSAQRELELLREDAAARDVFFSKNTEAVKTEISYSVVFKE